MTFLVAPADGEVGVPTNSRVWIGAGITGGVFEGMPQSAIEVVGPDGVALDGFEGRLQSPMDTIDVFTPALLLEPETAYTVRVAGEDHATFTTGSQIDDEAPEAPEEIERRGWSRPPRLPDGFSCGDGRASHGLSFSWDLGDSLLIVLDNDGAASLDEAAIEGSAPAITPFGSASLGTGFACGGDNWDEARRGSETMVRWASFDLAGNFSGWTAPQEAIVSRDGSGGCAMSGSADASWSALLLLGLVGLGASRRR